MGLFSQVAKRYKISDFKCRPVEMSYAFEHSDIPDQGTYLEVIILVAPL